MASYVVTHYTGHLHSVYDIPYIQLDESYALHYGKSRPMKPLTEQHGEEMEEWTQFRTQMIDSVRKGSMAFNEGINTCSTDILTMSLMINIQRGKEFNDEAEVLDWFSENGFGISDEHLTHNSGRRIGYAVYESVNSTIFYRVMMWGYLQNISLNTYAP